MQGTVIQSRWRRVGTGCLSEALVTVRARSSRKSMGFVALQLMGMGSKMFVVDREVLG